MVGYRRAAFFMGLGCNAARRDDLIDYHLDHATKFRLLPESIEPEALKHWKEEFYRWIVTCGFREIVDHTGVFLDQVYEAVSILVDHKRNAPKLRKFQRGGLKDKVETLRNQYRISCRYPETIASVGLVRNCLVHRLGLVGPEDTGTAGVLILKWFGLKMIFRGENGTDYPGPDITNPAALPWTTPCEGTIAAQFQLFEEKYVLGKTVILTPHTLQQVLWSMQMMADDYIRALTERARQDGRLKE